MYKEFSIVAQEDTRQFEEDNPEYLLVEYELHGGFTQCFSLRCGDVSVTHKIPYESLADYSARGSIVDLLYQMKDVLDNALNNEVTA